MGRLADAVAGTPILSAWHNTNRDRTINNFASAAERASQWTSPPNGAFSYLVDQPGVLWYYDAGAWKVAGMTRRTGGTWTRAAVQSIPHGVETTILWDTELADTDAFLAPTSGTVTIPAGPGGLWAISAGIFHTWANNGGLEGVGLILPIGTYRSYGTANNPVALGMSVAATVLMGGGSTISVGYLQGTGGPQNVTARLDVYKVGI